MAQFRATVSLGDLNLRNSLKIFGENDRNLIGASLARMGDFNGDGIDDVLIGSAQSPDPRTLIAGGAYILYGREGGYSDNVDLKNDNVGDFSKYIGTIGSFAGYSVAGVGDVDGDGLLDAAVGAFYKNSKDDRSVGSVYILYGTKDKSRFPTKLEELNGNTGLEVIGERADDIASYSLSGGGDINGDGIDDILISAPTSDIFGYSEVAGKAAKIGYTYVLFGVKGGLGSKFHLKDINGKNGFRISGDSTLEKGGVSVESISDFNGDGIDDMAVVSRGGIYSNTVILPAVHIIFGKTSLFDRDIKFSNLDGVNGFSIRGFKDLGNGLFSNKAIFDNVSSAGDVNGDGLSDIIISGAGLFSPSSSEPDQGRAYVVFGRANESDKNFSLYDLNGSNGFELQGEQSGDYSGRTVASAGDVNGDGFDDVIVAGLNGYLNNDRFGSAYVVFGKKSGFESRIELASLNGTTGFKISGNFSAEFDGRSFSGVGDINNDGFDDIAIGEVNKKFDPTENDSTYIIYGRAPDQIVNLVGTVADQTLSGGSFNDILDGQGGADKLFGHEGDDTYFVDNSKDLVFEKIKQGIDKIFSHSSYELSGGQEVEFLELLESTGTLPFRLSGNQFDQTLIGNKGSNILDGKAGSDTLIGRGGNDTYFVDRATDKVIEDRKGGFDKIFSSTSYSLVVGQEIEGLELISATGVSRLNLAGNEFGQNITGNNGVNFLDGKLGNDVLTGSKGSDTFVFSTPLGSSNVDRITDFAIEDTMRLSKSVFKALAPGQLKASEFKDIGKGKVDANDHVLYDSRNGNLFYDSDGSGKAAAVKFVILDDKAVITYADFLIV